MRLDTALGDLVLEVPEDEARRPRINGRRLESGRRVLLGGETIAYEGRRARLIAPKNATSKQASTASFARALLGSPLGAASNFGPCLVVLEGRWAGRRWPLIEGTQSIGRSTEADIVLSDPTVSRSHAQVIVSEGTIIIKDLGGRHGVRVDRRLARTGERTIGEDSEITIGSTKLRLMTPTIDEPENRPAIDLAEPGSTPVIKSPAPRIAIDRKAFIVALCLLLAGAATCWFALSL